MILNGSNLSYLLELNKCDKIFLHCTLYAVVPKALVLDHLLFNFILYRVVQKVCSY